MSRLTALRFGGLRPPVLRLGAGLLLLALAARMGQAQAAAPESDTLRFTLDRTGAASTHYSIEVDRRTRKGTFLQAGAAASVPLEAAVPLEVSEAVARKIFAAGPLVRSNRCDSHREGIAQTGTKTLRLLRDGTASECSYNYSEDERVNTATTVFEALALTLETGQRLAGKLRFDRLGLDDEIDSLQSALSDCRALEVGNIAPVLEQIQNDDRVMDRVRRKAALLLQGTGLSAAPAASDTGR